MRDQYSALQTIQAQQRIEELHKHVPSPVAPRLGHLHHARVAVRSEDKSFSSMQSKSHWHAVGHLSAEDPQRKGSWKPCLMKLIS